MISPRDFRRLAAIDGPCLSIVQPLRDTFSQVTKTDTRLIHATQKADALLAATGLDEEGRQRFLQPVRRLAGRFNGPERIGSVAIFRAPGFTKLSFWPGTLDPRVELKDEFFILPLLAQFGTPRDFWVLALSLNDIHLFRGDARGIAERELPKRLPLSLAEAGGFDQPDHDLEGRSAPGASSGQAAAIRFGTSSAHEAKARHIHDFFRMIDRAIKPILARTGYPLILATVARELAIYRDVNTYPHLLDQAIHGSPDALGGQRLHRAALELLAAGSTAADERFHREMDAAAGKGLLLKDPAAILQAAALGQVERLFVRAGSHADEDSINRAALAVYRNSGDVICANLSVVDGISAILRYRAAGAFEPRLAASQA